MTTQEKLPAGVGTNKVTFWVDPDWARDPMDPKKIPWEFRVRELDAVARTAHFREFRLKGLCFTEDSVQDGELRSYIACERSTVKEEGDVIVIENDMSIHRPPPEGAAKIVLVRFNTDSLRDDRLWRWRVFEGDGVRFEPRLVRQVGIHGICYGKTHDFPEEGRKMHVACRGVVEYTCKGTVAVILTEL